MKNEVFKEKDKSFDLEVNLNQTKEKFSICETELNTIKKDKD